MNEKSIKTLRKKITYDLSSAGIRSAEIDAQIILEFVTGKSREFLLAHPEYELSNDEYKATIKCSDHRKSLCPIAYITGHKEFFGLDFEVTKDVLIPRPETEILVEEGLKFLELRIMNYELLSEDKQLRIWDVGTGSGNIIISIAKYTKDNPLRFEAIASNLNYYASDNSEKALMVAKKNAKKHGTKIIFTKSDLFENINGKFDLIIANLPYVPDRFESIGSNRSGVQEIDFEPQNAIFANDNGTTVIKRFLDQAQNHINKNGLILVEVDPRNAIELRKYAGKLYKTVEVKKDFSGIYRLLLILT